MKFILIVINMSCNLFQRDCFECPLKQYKDNINKNRQLDVTPANNSNEIN